MSISTVTSEALQLKLRQLLPSQQGFGTDLSASDTIIPVIDLTASAEGSDVRQDLQTAYSFAGITAFEAANSTATLMNTAGFWRVEFAFSTFRNSSNSGVCTLDITDGSTSKKLYEVGFAAAQTDDNEFGFKELVFFLQSGDSVSVTAAATGKVTGFYRQIADTNGTLIQPTGFTPS
tara:strand:- start:1521 stop:2051 length:531 start_codon:yes stop_codon:yes gene_type:complete